MPDSPARPPSSSPRSSPPAAPGVWFYTSETTEYTYAFGNRLVGQMAAQALCNDVGGHLVTWTSRDEQAEVEGCAAATLLLALPAAVMCTVAEPFLLLLHPCCR